MQIPKHVLEKITTLKNLPTLPHILIKLIKICQDEEVTLHKISKIIEKDPSLSVKMLRLVNSASRGLAKKVVSIDQAVALLGTNAIKNIAVCASIHQAFGAAKGEGSLNLKTFWWHSLRCAVMSRLISEEIHYNDHDEAFLAGLLHDIGRLIIYINFEDEYADLLKNYKDQPDQILAGEIQLGVPHNEIGAWLLQRWDLHPLMVDSVLYHHEPLERILDALPFVQIVYAANVLSHVSVQRQEEGTKIAEALFGFTSLQVEEFLTRADGMLKETADSLGIEVETPKKAECGISKVDMQKQDDLITEVRDVSLLLGSIQNLLEARDEDTILQVVRQGLQILFDVKDVLFFIYDQEKEGLIFKSINDESRYSMLKDLILPLKEGKSLLAGSLLESSALDSFSWDKEHETIITDKQIIGYIGTDGILCIPMLAHGEYEGVIVIGMDQIELSHLSKHVKLLNMFVDQAALIIHMDHLKRSHFQRIQSERINASVTLARKVAHEVNNPLGIIKNYLKILGMKLVKQNIAQDEIRIMNEEIVRISKILRILNTFSENKARNITPVDINALLSDIVKIAGEVLAKRAGIKTHLNLEHQLPMVIAEKDGLKQVFINLIKNAAEAMPEGGNLYIKTRHISSLLNESSRSKKVPCEGYAEITIGDDGSGISSEIRSQLFEPFITSKNGSHSGLGLSIVNNIVNELNGSITCESAKGEGSSFKIILGLATNDESVN